MNRAKEQAVDRLRAHYVRDDIDVDTYEQMVDVAWAAGAPEDLERLFLRLPALPGAQTGVAAPEASPAPALASPAEQREHGFQIAILGGSDRKGSWVPPRKLDTFAFMGGTGLDFREARLGPGVTEVRVLAFMGGAEIIVPPGVTVETSGIGIMGGFDGHDQSVPTSDPSAPVIRIRGLAVMGSIEVKMMMPGETSRDARRRVKEDRRKRRLGRRDS
ncbi:MAG: DUF1707 SHOCT-like domain-containing protein [Gemmatimonadota bacterium]